MTSRILPPEEWHRLADTELGPVIPDLTPERVTILVVENAEGQIVGTWALIRYLHAEGFWIHPDYRGHGSVLRRLMTITKHTAEAMGELAVWTSTSHDEVRELLAHAGAFPVPGTHHVLPTAAGERLKGVHHGD